MTELAMIRPLVLISVTAALSLGFVTPASSQIGNLRRKAQEAVQGRITCALNDTACQERARAEGKQVVIDSSKTDTTSSPAAAGPGRVGEGAWVNYDFTPGTRPLFVEDFSRDNVGDFPRRLEFGDGNMEVAEWQKTRLLRVTTTPAKFSIPLPEQLPERFTIEFDATPPPSNIWLEVRFAEGAADVVQFRLFNDKGQGGVSGANHVTQALSRPMKMGDMFRARIMADGRYVKVYMDGLRVANIPNADLGRSNKIWIETAAREDEPTFIGNISVMAGGKKLYDELSANGRVATQGIYFDTGSDVIRPESSPTLKEIAQMLSDHPELKLSIEGHTDNVGAAAANQTLSEKRANAVREALVTVYKVDAARLTAAGLGSTKPASSNDTPEGRQANRRVELVKS